MKRTVNTGDITTSTESPHDSNTPADLPAEQTQSVPVLSHRTPINSSMEIVGESTQSPITTGEYSEPEISSRSTNASTSTPSHKTDDFLENLKQKALSGDAEAQFELGVCYDNGRGVDKNDVEAFQWFQKAAGQGHAKAQFNLAVMYDEGEGVEADMEKAVYWYQKAAEQGDADAQFNLGCLFDRGEGVGVDKVKAIYWYQKAAEQGNAAAQCNLGIMYDEGEGVEIDKINALKWYQKAAEQGNAQAQCNLGHIYSKGQGVVIDKINALKWYQRAAEQGDANAQCILGFMYEKGEGVAVDKAKAFEWYQKAAVQGDAGAQCNLGFMYEKGRGVETDMKKAVEWYQVAANQEHVNAQCNLGSMYERGGYVEIDKVKAFEWYQKAAIQSYKKAMSKLSKAYHDGLGVSKNLELATYWMMKHEHHKLKISIDSINSGLLEFVPSVLKKYPEFKSVDTIKFHVFSSLSDDHVFQLAKFIRSDASIKFMIIDQYRDFVTNSQAGVLAKALENNIHLVKLEFDIEEPFGEDKKQITSLLIQNKHVAELRQYVEDHPLIYSAGFPLDIVNIMMDKMIVSYLRKGETKEATQQAIDEFLVSVSLKPLEEESIMQ